MIWIRCEFRLRRRFRDRIVRTANGELPPLGADTMTQLRQLGVGLSIDDFGTGYSSLSYLRRFPVDLVKIDRSFVEQLGTDEQSATIVEAIIGLAHALDLAVVAEGVESEGQLAFLEQAGCEQMQGFVVSRALDAAAFPAFMRGYRRQASASRLTHVGHDPIPAEHPA